MKRDVMTVRDEFAARAMAALITGPDLNDNHYEDDVNEYVAGRAYHIANAMMRMRKYVLEEDLEGEFEGKENDPR